MNLVILGVKIDNCEKDKLPQKLNDFLNDNKQHYITTPNPEIILSAQHDEELLYILNKSDLSLPDGIGIKIAGWLCGENIQRTTGADILLEILKLANDNSKKVAILTWKNGLSRKNDVINSINKEFKNIKIYCDEIDRNWHHYDLTKLKEFAADILIVALGAPWQEKFIYHQLKELQSIKFAIGVGGGIDFFTGKVKRAPEAFRSIGLEWLWRLMIQPWRIKRIFNAVIIFPIKFISWKYLKRFFYRSNVIGYLYKKENNVNKVLIVERKVEPGHWQLPQGGTDGQTLVEAGKRELMEELNTDKFKVVASFKNIHKFKFPNNINKYGIDSKTFWGHKGQKQGVVVAEFLGDDSDIKINFWEHTNWKWVNESELVNSVFPVRREVTQKIINKINSK